MDRPIGRLARAGTNPELVTRVAAIVAERWDLAAEFPAPDGERSARSHAVAVLGVLGAGGRRSEVIGYLRRAEEGILVFPRSTAEARQALATEIEAIVLDTPT